MTAGARDSYHSRRRPFAETNAAKRPAVMDERGEDRERRGDGRRRGGMGDAGAKASDGKKRDARDCRAGRVGSVDEDIYVLRVGGRGGLARGGRG